ncbi:hypothetical protein V5O48_006424 [Marasmius crinis-equi]|uniref:Arrestin C-terminal-like domain-containing protein n=1 Tax=Marasmius crinis-equi TaxID=585013 RepID=A0ABR3FJQ7_9AGAR
MAFVFNGPLSPSIEDPHQHEASSTAYFPLLNPSEANNDMGGHHKDKERPRLEILLDKESIYLKGTGPDVEPAILSGHVVLYLTESTSIKEITLQFRGKARLPVPSYDSMSLNSSPLTYIICNHEWSFLEGEKKHSHTLKAGRHFFPFQLQLGGSLPSSISTAAFGGASVAYKLRAHVSRPGFNHNLQSILPVHVIRSFAAEALEYQQTLEIENTWPEKIMYSIMMPHKAWAAGDTLTALVKFSPLLKGVGVLNINTTIHETTKVFARSGHQEMHRVVATAKHEVVGGKAIEVPEFENRGSKSSTNTPAHTPSAVGAPSRTSSTGNTNSYFTFNPQTFTHSDTLPEAGPSTSNSAGVAIPSTPPAPEGFEVSHNDIVSYLAIRIPLSITPTHGLDPIIVSHRIRWSILLLNPDGHTSELRCSLPLHLLDHRLLEEARLHTLATRRLLVGTTDVSADHTAEEDDMELPSYNAHLRDRVANMYLPESATMRVTNPWVRGSVSPVAYPSEIGSPWPLSRSGQSTPLEAQAFGMGSHSGSVSPRGEAASPGGAQALDWVNSELLLSLSTDAPPNLGPSSRGTPAGGVSRSLPTTPTGSGSNSNSNSEPNSRSNSRPNSRGNSRSSSRNNSKHPSRASSPEPRTSTSSETYVHSQSNASRSIHGLYKASMKPLSSLSSGWLHSRSGSHGSLASMASHNNHHHHNHPSTHHGSTSSSPASSRPTSSHGLPAPADYTTGTALLHRAFTEVPGYGIASRGFLGGVPPLSSMSGLPSYEEASAAGSPATSPHTPSPLSNGQLEASQRARSDGDILSRLSQVSVSSS